MKSVQFFRSMAACLLGAALLLTGCAGGTAPTSSVSDTMEDMTSMELVADMGVGWNLGNTLDVCVADRDGDGKVNEAPAEGEKVDETLWGNVRTTPELFAHLKEDGVNAVRIPVTWRDHLSDDGKDTIDPEWLERVGEVVNYAYEQDMYVIVNMHHDGGGDPKFGAWIRTNEAGFEDVRARYKRIWTQIAEYFKGYDERLILESMNEVGFEDHHVQLPRAYEMLNTLNQDFVDLVRASGGNNAERHLLIAGYWTDIEMTCSAYFIMPEDPADRLILSVHYYTPYQFCITGERKIWGAGGDAVQMGAMIRKMANTYCSQGVPVIIGEYGMVSRETESRIAFSKTLTELCKENGMAAFFWDNGEEFDRETYEWRTEGLIEALNEAVSG